MTPDYLETVSKAEQALQKALEAVSVQFQGEEKALNLHDALYHMVKTYGVDTEDAAARANIAGNFRNIYELFGRAAFATAEEREDRLELNKANLVAQKESEWEKAVLENARKQRKQREDPKS